MTIPFEAGAILDNVLWGCNRLGGVFLNAGAEVSMGAQLWGGICGESSVRVVCWEACRGDNGLLPILSYIQRRINLVTFVGLLGDSTI